VKLTLSRISKIVESYEFKTLRDLNADDVETFLTEFREEDDIGFLTYAHYRIASEWSKFDRSDGTG
jgi:hypothetical protein